MSLQEILRSIYLPHSARVLKIIVNIDDDTLHDPFYRLLTEYILSVVKLCKNFTLETVESSYFNEQNYIFYVVNYTDLSTALDHIKKIATTLTHPRSHLFIIINCTDKMEIDDDGDLVFTDDDVNGAYQEFYDNISKNIPETIYHACRIDLNLCAIWKKILVEGTIANLTDGEINLLNKQIGTKSDRTQLVDKKREVRLAIRKISVEDKLAESGYNELLEYVLPFFKQTHQKVLVVQNYLAAVNRIIISTKLDDITQIDTVLYEIYGIDYLKENIHRNLLEQTERILREEKLCPFYAKMKNEISICTSADVAALTPAPSTKKAVTIISTKKTAHTTTAPTAHTTTAPTAPTAPTTHPPAHPPTAQPTTPPSTDVYEYHKILSKWAEIAKTYNMVQIMKQTKAEIDAINKLIIDHYNKEMEKITDLDKIGAVLEIFSQKDPDTLLGLFHKIIGTPRIITENISQTDKWIELFNRCVKYGISSDLLVRLLEEIIVHKFTYFSDANKHHIYPQCLQLFLLTHLSNGFIFQKLYLYTAHTIRYSGRNITDLIKNLTAEDMKKMLALEHKLLELVLI